jgi:hypothetical protein
MGVVMKHRIVVVMAGALLAATVAVAPAAAGPAPAHPLVAAPTANAAQAAAGVQNLRDWLHQYCLRTMRAAVEEDNAAFEARDANRYRAILNPDLVVDRDGSVTYGRDPAMESAIAFFQVPDWHWQTKILSATVYGCSTGVAIVDAHQFGPGAFDYHAHVAMTMTRATGRWTVAMDYVHLISKTPTG